MGIVIGFVGLLGLALASAGVGALGAVRMVRRRPLRWTHRRRARAASWLLHQAALPLLLPAPRDKDGRP